MPRMTSSTLCEACGTAVDLRQDRHYSRAFTARRGRDEEQHVRFLCFPCAGSLGSDREAFLASTLPPHAKRRAA